ncbi:MULTISPECIES: hypothetical protein [unclassified Brenneria]|nr:hypothetical protein [Brenneria sp. L3-3C-1]MEE3644495.1 hypothetical protein [Brenneria sp. L3_3C_1]
MKSLCCHRAGKPGASGIESMAEAARRLHNMAINSSTDVKS